MSGSLVETRERPPGARLERLAAHRQVHLGADVELAEQQVAANEFLDLLDVAFRRERLLPGAAPDEANVPPPAPQYGADGMTKFGAEPKQRGRSERGAEAEQRLFPMRPVFEKSGQAKLQQPIGGGAEGEDPRDAGEKLERSHAAIEAAPALAHTLGESGLRVKERCEVGGKQRLAAQHDEQAREGTGADGPAGKEERRERERTPGLVEVQRCERHHSERQQVG